MFTDYLANYYVQLQYTRVMCRHFSHSRRSSGFSDPSQTSLASDLVRAADGEDSGIVQYINSLARDLQREGFGNREEVTLEEFRNKYERGIALAELSRMGGMDDTGMESLRVDRNPIPTPPPAPSPEVTLGESGQGTGIPQPTTGFNAASFREMTQASRRRPTGSAITQDPAALRRMYRATH